MTTRARPRPRHHRAVSARDSPPFRSGGATAYELDERPLAGDDCVLGPRGDPLVIDALAHDSDPSGDLLRFVNVAGTPIDVEDLAPRRRVHGLELPEPGPTHTPRTAGAWITLQSPCP